MYNDDDFNEEDIYDDDDYDFEEDDDYHEDEEETIETQNESIESALVNIPESFGNPEQFKNFQQELKDNGIVFLHNYWCCQSCGGADLSNEYENGNLNGYFGYAYYHNQDLERYEQDGKLYLAWGCLEDGFSNNMVEEIGKKIVEIAMKHNFTINWDNSVHTRIIIA